jgi:mono/diheme cytochrome c family protein
MMLLTSLMLMLMMGWSGASSRPLQAPEPPGKAPYARVCQVCHGPEGRGDAGPSLVPLDKDYDEVLTMVREGGGQMPPITAERVSDDEVRQIVEYLKSLKGAADR